jgi:hypothetical protein
MMTGCTRFHPCNHLVSSRAGLLGAASPWRVLKSVIVTARMAIARGVPRQKYPARAERWTQFLRPSCFWIKSGTRTEINCIYPSRVPVWRLTERRN